MTNHRSIPPPGPCFGWANGVSGDCGLPYGHDGDHVLRETVELRAELDALRAAMATLACPYVVTSDEGTSYCRLAEAPVGRPEPGIQ